MAWALRLKWDITCKALSTVPDSLYVLEKSHLLLALINPLSVEEGNSQTTPKKPPRAIYSLGRDGLLILPRKPLLPQENPGEGQGDGCLGAIFLWSGISNQAVCAPRGEEFLSPRMEERERGICHWIHPPESQGKKADIKNEIQIALKQNPAQCQEVWVLSACCFLSFFQRHKRKLQGPLCDEGLPFFSPTRLVIQTHWYAEKRIF